MIEIAEITEHPDGSTTLALDVTIEELTALAKIGLQHVIEKEVAKLADGYTNTEGSEDPDAGPYGGGPVYTDVP